MEKKKVQKTTTRKIKAAPKTPKTKTKVTAKRAACSSAKKSCSSRHSKVIKIDNMPALKSESKKVEPKNKNGFSFLDFMNDFAQALVIAAVILLLVISFIIVGNQKRLETLRSPAGQDYFSVLEGSKVVKKDKNFFGILNFQSEESLMSESSDVLGMGSYDGAVVGSTQDRRLPSASSDLLFIEDKAYPSEIGIMPPYYFSEYNYVYSGGDFPLFPAEVEVYRKSNPDLSNGLSSLLSNKKISFFDIGKFRNISVNNMTINEERDFGYSIYLGLKDGNFSIYKNWEKWPSWEKVCGGYDYDCFESYRLSLNDVPNDSEIINIANKFLRDYGINLDNFGPGEVQKQWMRDYILSSNKASFYIPESINVIYPLRINGLDVYGDNGQKSGLSVEVDIREKRAAGVYNLFYQHYESSVYETEKDVDLILSIAKRGGAYQNLRSYYDKDIEVKTIDIELGTPTLAMMKVWHYDQVAMKGYELFVPAYVFPVLSESEPSHFYRQNIVIPAVRDFFSHYNNVITPEPYLINDVIDDENSVSGSSGSGVSGSRGTISQ